MASPVAEIRTRLEATAAAFVKENRLPGAAVGIVHEDKLVWSKGIGFADVKKKRRADPKTLYRIASITKTFTATAVMQLRDKGKLALDDPLVTYLPELASARSTFAPIEGLTIRRLLSHESGLQSEPPDTDFSGVLYESEAAKNLARAADISLTVPPNTQWKYSNLGYQLLGELVARVSGMTYARYIRSKILTPLKMTSTALDPLPQRLQARRAVGYEPRFLSDELEPGAAGARRVPGRRRAVVVRRGPRALALLPVRSRAGAVGADGRRDAQAALPRRPGVDARVGDRLVRVPKGRRRLDMHSGGHYGFITNACFDPKEKVGAIALFNGFGNATGLAMDLGKLAREAVKSAAPKIEAPSPLPKKWRDLVGLYVMQHFGSIVRLEWRDGKLTFIDPTDPTWMPTIAPTDDPDVFMVEPGFRESGELVRFQRGNDGRVVSVIAAVSTMERLEPVGR